MTNLEMSLKKLSRMTTEEKLNNSALVDGLADIIGFGCSKCIYNNTDVRIVRISGEEYNVGCPSECTCSMGAVEFLKREYSEENAEDKKDDGDFEEERNISTDVNILSSGEITQMFGDC